MAMPTQSSNNDEGATANTQKPRKRYSFNQRIDFWILLLIAIVLAGIIWQRESANRHQSNHKQAIPVVLATVKTADVPVYLSALGSVVPTTSVTVRTQINGTLLKVFYHEGQMVKTGDLIALIDPRPYEAQLLQYQGQLTRDQALYANAITDLKRYEKLWKLNSVSQQTLATQQSLVKQYQGTVQIDQGLIDATKLNLAYCNITAPIDGRIGLRLVDSGNYVQTGDATGIAVINSLNPITVIFTIPEDNISDVLAKIYAKDDLTVYAYDRQENKLLATGALLTIDNQIDPNTGTVKLRAQFSNDKSLLFPSQFVNVRLLVKVLSQALTVPTAAIQYNAKGSFIYIVDANEVATVTPVTTSVTNNGDTVVTSGVTVGERVVIEGADKLIDGAKVTLADDKNDNTNLNDHKKRHSKA